MAPRMDVLQIRGVNMYPYTVLCTICNLKKKQQQQHVGLKYGKDLDAPRLNSKAHAS